MDEPSMSRQRQAIDVVVRFSNTNPDIILSISSPASLTGLSLKRLIRAELSTPTSESRLRLIHSGKVIPDATALDRSLTPIFPPPSAHAHDPLDKNVRPLSANAKGKQPLRPNTIITVPPARVYVHCSVGDVLSETDLTTEARKAQESEVALTKNPDDLFSTDPASSKDHDANPSSSTTPSPRGFDRLLSAGFTTAEVAALRTQFLAIQAHSHTPDTMPTGAELLSLEERWLDNGSSSDGGASQGGSETRGGGGVGEDTSGLEDMLYGNLMGFFWPVGAVCWLMREEGVWSRRRQIAVLGGLLVNLTFGWLSVRH